ncbi:hypothetical protein KSB_13960 [Ktedonobacter robiniae]|uniref:Secreted protein n=1 Tax=Ktedonobacter robiniae TaxID=2778365 RepID=A0ABQ3UJQ6_9CHLR|nr:hypothetical protein KSB_13960 [Ktedonobacter robiniae]
MLLFILLRMCKALTYAMPQAKTHKFTAGLKPKIFRIDVCTMTQDEPAQHLYLFRFGRLILLKGDVLR